MRRRPRIHALSAALLTLACAGGSAHADSNMKTGLLDRTVLIDGQPHRYQVFVPADYAPTRRWPVILFQHGSGERGADGRAPATVGLGTAIRDHAERYPALVVFPQAPADATWTGPAAAIALDALEQTTREFNVDPDRVYLTGLSLGGSGTWYLAYREPRRFAALLVICARMEQADRDGGRIVPAEDGPMYETLAARLRDVPTWIFHGDADDVIPVEQARRIHAALRAVGAPVRYTEIAGGNHNAWDAAYSSAEVANWLFSQRRGP